VAVGEFNGDSDPDLALADDFGRSAAVLEGGDGTSFSAPSRFALSNALSPVVVEDLNGDDLDDMALSVYFSNKVAVLQDPSDDPVARDYSYEVDEDSTTTLDVPANDTDVEGDSLRVYVISHTSTAMRGSLQLATEGQLTYTPPQDFTGKESFDYTITDGKGGTDRTSATINVTPVNDKPTVAVSGGECLSDTSALGKLNLTVADVDSPLSSLGPLSATSSNTSLIPNTNPERATSSEGEYTLNAVSKKSGKAILTLSVSDGEDTGTLPVTIRVGTQKSETIKGESGVDVIFGPAGQGVLEGGGGSDLVCGGNGDDKVNGGDGNDFLDGGRGNDILNGEAGNDKLRGGEGNDRLEGGNDADTLSGGLGADLFSGGAGSDTATDFTPGQGDTKDATIP
jgi:Ca2+-binding RTX toxin-like protein